MYRLNDRCRLQFRALPLLFSLNWMTDGRTTSRDALVRQQLASLSEAERQLDAMPIGERNRAALVKRQKLKETIATRRASYQDELKSLDNHTAWQDHKMREITSLSEAIA